MPADLLLKDVRPPGGETVDLLVAGGRIAAIGPGLTPPPGAEVIAGGGRLLFPGFVDAHAHLDKSLIGLGWERNEVGPSILEMIANERRLRRERGIDPAAQSARQARLAIAAGTTQIRTFVDVDTDWGLAGFAGVMRTRADLAPALAIQVVAFPQSGLLVRPGTLALMEEALSNGAEVVGGLDPSAIDRDPKGHLDTVFALAEKHDKDVDVHLHEPGELGAFAVELIAERTKALGWQGRVVISHAFCLGGVDDTTLGRLIDLLLEHEIAVMSHGPSGPRPFPPLKRLRAAGVRMCAGNDGVRDAWSPLNMPDMLLRAFLLAYRNGLRRDDDLELVLDIVTDGGAAVIGAADYGLAPGAAADLVLIDGENHLAAMIERPPRRLVLKGGQVVARDGECLV